MQPNPLEQKVDWKLSRKPEAYQRKCGKMEDHWGRNELTVHITEDHTFSTKEWRVSAEDLIFFVSRGSIDPLVLPPHLPTTNQHNQ